MDSMDKEWAQKYLLDPLTAPEPSQIHAAELRESQVQYSKPRKSSGSSSSSDKKKSGGDKTPKSSSSKTSHNNPYTPPPSASPTASSFHPSNPFSDNYSPTTPTRTPRIAVDRTPSGSSDSSTGSTRPPSYRKVADHPPSTSDRRTRPRSTSAYQDSQGAHHRSSSSSSSTAANHRQILGQQLPQRSASNGHQHRRNTSLPQRFPGDMSHRPLDMIKRENKAADRHPHHRSSHRRHRSAASQTDTIDALDTIGGSYHHGGPYDATLASRNLDEKYSPLAAVRDSNMEALRATPREYIEDSLQKHVPLQGTATVPSGAYDFSGKLMHYSEGADLMREPDAPGGAYKRWDGVQYHPDDLKGKGEPSYTIERDAKKMKEREGLLRPEGIEMTVPFRQRSRSHGATDGAEASSSGLGVHRSNTTGKSGSKLSEGLKKRFGSIRRKKEVPAESVR